MRLEDEIKQDKFRDEWQKLIVNLIYTGNWIAKENADFLKPYQLSVQQYNVMRILRGQYPEPVTINVIIDRMLDKMSNASRLVDKLGNKGLAKREPSQQDRRRVNVVITEKGLRMLKKIDKDIVNLESGYGKHITKEEAKTLNKLLDKIRG